MKTYKVVSTKTHSNNMLTPTIYISDKMHHLYISKYAPPTYQQLRCNTSTLTKMQHTYISAKMQHLHINEDATHIYLS